MLCVSSLRKRIDLLDRAVLDLVNQRLSCALEIARLKKEKQLVLCDSEREKEILARLQAYNQGPLSQEDVKELFRVVLALSKRCMQDSESQY